MNNRYTPYWHEELARWLYTLLLCLLLPVFWLKFRKWGVNQIDAYHSNFLQRLGFVPVPANRQGYLFHCVSVGEVMAASCVIKKLQKLHPDIPVTITTTTETGSARVNTLFGDSVHHFYLPLDLPFAMNAMLNRLQPQLVVITEVELWPNLIHCCWKKGISAVVINARMTERSASRYAKVSALFEPMMFKLSHVCAQGERDFEHYAKLGIPEDKLTLTNNIKFDQAISDNLSETDFLQLRQNNRPVIVAGSTHDPEEKVLLTAFSTIIETHPNALLAIVPRHPQRFKEVEKLLADSPFEYRLSSEAHHVTDDVQVLLVNEMGKLNHLYQVAKIAFVGGSLADKGGHNALEPAAAAVPILMGPHQYNNSVICDYLRDHGALYLVNNANDISRHCLNWLEHPAQADELGRAGFAVLTKNQGAVDATIACLESAK
ncbi:lipid IV(A) 3-deoxy-D-manno-octulosonic acid transferase [Alteromonas ponticola]|uniref:3-deoxy-D-manno-octulosonic acid transferase n=1 Tax=Alteromonas aquimaris TaxID=2998417 RepID=A0ABT3PAJ6_9ALTE|nr:lipid IV(A) 3-deoxy-D-manno-octulosonic acid transferase [Alteromonas aquimaris]MCW8109795.1 lipid IV(A) 3-deoxy-D-manno-octulosonic acid transferase [Alteromonas aquimaris]